MFELVVGSIALRTPDFNGFAAGLSPLIVLAVRLAFMGALLCKSASSVPRKIVKMATWLVGDLTERKHDRVQRGSEMLCSYSSRGCAAKGFHLLILRFCDFHRHSLACIALTGARKA